MGTYKTYKELEVWKKARLLAMEVYKATQSFPKEELYGITSQLRRASVSVAANISEGCGRQYKKETIQFLHISRGSLYELETELYIAFDIGYLKEDKLKNLLQLQEECLKLLHGFVNYMEKAELN